MKRVVRWAVLVAVAFLGWLAPSASDATAASNLPTAASHCTYDAPTYDPPENYKAPERGPPVEGFANPTYGAGDLWSDGASTRSKSTSAPDHPATYDASAMVAKITGDTGTTQTRAQGDSGGLSGVAPWQVAANSGGRVFWSGGDMAKNAAADFAKANGAKTIEMTRTGRALEWLTDKTSYNLTKPLWERASARFAKGASGQAHVFFGPGGPSVFSTYSNIENPILQSNGVRIFTHWAWE